MMPSKGETTKSTANSKGFTQEYKISFLSREVKTPDFENELEFRRSEQKKKNTVKWVRGLLEARVHLRSSIS